MNVKLHAAVVAVEDEEDYWLVGFADHEFETQDYLTLERGYEDDEQDIALGMATYHVERNGQGWSCYGGLRRFVLSRDRIQAYFDDTGTAALGGVSEMEITFQIDGRRFGKLSRRLQRIFAGTDCALELA